MISAPRPFPWCSGGNGHIRDVATDHVIMAIEQQDPAFHLLQPIALTQMIEAHGAGRIRLFGSSFGRSAKTLSMA